MEKYFPENKRVRPRILKDEFWKNKKAPPNLIWWTLKDGKRESPSVHKSIDEESDDESESESEEEEQSQQSQQSYGNWVLPFSFFFYGTEFLENFLNFSFKVSTSIN